MRCIPPELGKVQGEIALMEKKASDAILKPPLVPPPLQDIESTKADLEAEFESKVKPHWASTFEGYLQRKRCLPNCNIDFAMP